MADSFSAVTAVWVSFVEEMVPNPQRHLYGLLFRILDSNDFIADR